MKIRPTFPLSLFQIIQAPFCGDGTCEGKIKKDSARYCLLFIVLFAKNCTNQIKSNYLNSHGEEAQEKPPGFIRNGLPQLDN